MFITIIKLLTLIKFITLTKKKNKTKLSLKNINYLYIFILLPNSVKAPRRALDIIIVCFILTNDLTFFVIFCLI